MRLLAVASPNKKKILIWAVKFSVLFVVFLVFFLPLQREADIVASNMASMKDQMGDLKKISTSLLTPQELEETKKNLESFGSKLVDFSKAGALVDLITTEADKNHFNVIQIYTDSPLVAKDDVGKDLELDSKKLMWLPVNFRVETDYKDFGNFLRSLAENPTYNFIVESMLLKKTAPESENLQCDITVSFIAK